MEKTSKLSNKKRTKPTVPKRDLNEIRLAVDIMRLARESRKTKPEIRHFRYLSVR